MLTVNTSYSDEKPVVSGTIDNDNQIVLQVSWAWTFHGFLKFYPLFNYIFTNF